MTTINIIILFIIIVILYLASIYCSESFVNYKYEDKEFMVLEEKESHNIAAKMLHDVDKSILLLINHINIKYNDIDSLDCCNDKKSLLYKIKNRLNRRYKSESLRENFPSRVGIDVSYNTNKGEDISLCLRNYDNPKEFHEHNDVLFVAIHEVAHSCNESYGHDMSFWKIFRILLEEAVELKIYTNINYKKEKVNYCSMNITYNPIFDRKLDDDNYFR